jgi:hypothetical protein
MANRALLFFTTIAGSILVALAACGGATTTSLGSTDDGQTGNDASASSSGSNAGSDASAGYDSASNGSDASAPAMCGESGTKTYPPCPSTMWCDRGSGVCGGLGYCKNRPPPPPPSCPAYPEMVCGCDGKAYCSTDDARSVGVEIAVQGGCKTPCGTTSCDAVTEYCDHAFGGVALPDGGSNQWYSCKKFSEAGCAEKRTCACVQANPSKKGEACTEPNGHVEVQHFLP